jgi:hypothetical protein
VHAEHGERVVVMGREKTVEIVVLNRRRGCG